MIVFDEAQMLPNDYLKPCVAMIEELINMYEVSAVLCTATQPALDSFFCKEKANRALSGSGRAVRLFAACYLQKCRYTGRRGASGTAERRISGFMYCQYEETCTEALPGIAGRRRVSFILPVCVPGTEKQYCRRFASA